ncbi:hypothetical protein SDC9_166779 [bioreactor metagenome]|uniref:Uncharacterized protein n=1 Tax=bioreactor metagenome TaxID=1076179 RepID=A0A645G0I0_9ZZZZ
MTPATMSVLSSFRYSTSGVLSIDVDFKTAFLESIRNCSLRSNIAAQAAGGQVESGRKTGGNFPPPGSGFRGFGDFPDALPDVFQQDRQFPAFDDHGVALLQRRDHRHVVIVNIKPRHVVEDRAWQIADAAQMPFSGLHVLQLGFRAADADGVGPDAALKAFAVIAGQVLLAGVLQHFAYSAEVEILLAFDFEKLVIHDFQPFVAGVDADAGTARAVLVERL